MERNVSSFSPRQLKVIGRDDLYTDLMSDIIVLDNNWGIALYKDLVYPPDLVYKGQWVLTRYYSSKAKGDRGWYYSLLIKDKVINPAWSSNKIDGMKDKDWIIFSSMHTVWNELGLNNV